MADGVNGDQGAESVVSFLLSLLTVLESCPILDRVRSAKNVARPNAHLPGEPIPKTAAEMPMGLDDEATAQTWIGEA
jgi:hypothetical protein